MLSDKNKLNKIKNIIILQLAVILFTWSGIFGKMATNGNGFFSPGFFLFVFLDLAVLGIYAIIWQQILRKFDLHVAYANRAVAIFWVLLWSVIIFKDTINIFNIIGTGIIVTGIILVTIDD